MTPPGVVYFIREKDDPTGPIRIGYTSRTPDDRLFALQAGNVRELEVIAAHEGFWFHELALHAWLAEDCLRRDWYAPSDRLLAVVAGETPLQSVRELTPATEGAA